MPIAIFVFFVSNFAQTMEKKEAQLPETQLCAQILFWPAQDELHFSKTPMVKFTKLSIPKTFAELKKEIAQKVICSEDIDQITVHNNNVKLDNPEMIDSFEKFLAHKRACKKMVMGNLKAITFLQLFVYDKNRVEYDKDLCAKL